LLPLPGSNLQEQEQQEQEQELQAPSLWRHATGQHLPLSQMPTVFALVLRPLLDTWLQLQQAPASDICLDTGPVEQAAAAVLAAKQGGSPACVPWRVWHNLLASRTISRPPHCRG
jgi:hypothetical protein